MKPWGEPTREQLLAATEPTRGDVDVALRRARASQASGGFVEQVHQFERALIVTALERSHWEIKTAAAALDLPYSTLQTMLQYRHADVDHERKRQLAKRRRRS